MIRAYHRVSTDRQDSELQLTALKGSGYDILYSDIESGTNNTRKGYLKLYESLQVGDVVRVWKLDRLTRDFFEAMKFFCKLNDLDCIFEDMEKSCLCGKVRDYHLEQHIILAFKASEGQEFIRKLKCNVRAGMAVAKSKGVHCGRPRKKL